MLIIEKFSEILAISTKGVKNSENALTVAKKLRGAGLKFKGCVVIGEINQKKIYGFQPYSNEPEISIKFLDHCDIQTASLVIRILINWGYNCRVFKKDNQGFINLFCPRSIFYEEDIPQ